MSGPVEDGYLFPSSVPLEPMPPGSTVLVAGPTFSPAGDLVRSMVTAGADAGEGSLFISTNETCEKFMESCRLVTPGLDTSRMAVIDCSGQDIGETEIGPRVKYVSTQNDLTGIGMKFSALYQSLYAEATDGRVRTGLLSLSSLAMYVDLRRLFQFAQTLSGRVDSAGGFGVFALDPTTHETKTINTLGQVADGRIEVRASEEPDADGELRVEGLRGQPDGWQPFSLPSE